jgi:hypothetical protein
MAKKLDDMMGAMGEMPAADSEESAPPVPASVEDGPSEVSEEELQHAKDMGFDGAQAAALKRFIRSCMASEDAGEYEDVEGSAPPTELGDM